MKLAMSLLIGAVACRAQQGWHEFKKTDSFRGGSYVQFEIEGKFLAAPKQASVEAPTLVVQCSPGERSAGYHMFKNGSRLASYLVVGAVLDSRPAGIQIQYRLDDGKVQEEMWSRSTDFAGAFFPEPTLNNILYGHVLPHKENSTPAVRKVVIATNEYLAGEIVMQFDMPNPQNVTEACGLVTHKRR